MSNKSFQRSSQRNTLGSMLLALVASAGLPAVGVMALGATSQAAVAQSSTTEDASVRKAKRDSLLALSKPITLDVEDQPIEDIFKFIADVTGADLQPIYLNDNTGAQGIDPETLVTLNVSNTPALIVLDRVLQRVQRTEGTGEEYTWQLSEYGTIECGPKTELNREQRVELYDISDLLFVVPDFNNAPNFNLQSAVAAARGGGGGGGGGGRSPFTGGTQRVTFASAQERADAISELIQSTIEPDQWAELGGDGAAMTTYGNSLVITAPDYIHRQIAGYSFWPAKLQQVRRVKGRQQTVIKPDTRKRRSP